MARRVELDHSKEFLALNPKALTNALQTALVYPATNLLAGASMEKSGNATHGFMDLILMMGIAGAIPTAYHDSLDLFHTMEAYFTWYPEGAVT